MIPFPPCTQRYEILEELGTGSTGRVFRAIDHDLRREVALKTLHGHAPRQIDWLKREFRVLAGYEHKNIVALHDLHPDEGHGFFTMELVRGRRFIDYVRQPQPGELASASMLRLRPALDQLARAIHFLHRIDLVHRDLKPSNVLVTAEGRVVVLDFGLAICLGASLGDNEQSVASSETERRFGTAAYMAPEQANGEPLGPAADWYAFGVLLFEALTGTLPFSGDDDAILRDKTSLEAPRPSLLSRDVPDDLDDLCVALLARSPQARPRANEVLSSLSGEQEAALSWRAIAAFVGREEEIRFLEDAFEASREGQPVLVHVRGPSGIGKTTLLRRFVDDVSGRGVATVLDARCHERETTRYKAFDGIIAQLGRVLADLPEGLADELLPDDIHLLDRLFPALLGDGRVGGRAARKHASPDAHELRRRSFACLQQLLARLSRLGPLILWVDDFQWADEDSNALMAALLSPPRPLVALWLVSSREGDGAGSASRALAGEVREMDLEVRPLEAAGVASLCSALLGDMASEAVIEAISRECEGSPFFVAELAGRLRKSVGDAPVVVSLDELLRDRVASTPSEPRRLLEVICIAGRPVEERVAYHAAALGDEAHRAALSLRAAGLVVAHGHQGKFVLEPFHDRIRAAVVASMTEEGVRRCHRRLADALTEEPQVDVQELIDHLQAAGDSVAGPLLVSAGDEASEALAFLRAASLYRTALAQGGADFEAWRVREKLARSLVDAGRSADAAIEYARAGAECRGASPDASEALNLIRLSAEHFLRSGHIQRGLDAMREVLGEVGGRFPKSPSTAIVWLAVERAKMGLQGSPKKARGRASSTPRQLANLEAHWSASLGLSMVDTARSAYFQSRYERIAFGSGDELHVARAMASGAAVLASEGGAKAHDRAKQSLEKAAVIAKRSGDPGLRALTQLCGGVAAFFSADFRHALELCLDAERIMNDECAGMSWELTNAHLYSLWSMSYLGKMADVAQLLPRVVHKGRERGDVYAATSLRIGLPNMLWLVRDLPDVAEREVDEAIHDWTAPGYHAQHYFELLSRTQIDLYRGDGWAAWHRVQQAWKGLDDSWLLRVQLVRVELHHLRARAALCAATLLRDGGPKSRAFGRARPSFDELLASAERDIREMTEVDVSWSQGRAAAIRAGVASLRGKPERVLRELQTAEAAFRDAGMALDAHAAQYVRAALAGQKPSEPSTAGERWMQAQGVVRPERIAALLFPAVGAGQ